MNDSTSTRIALVGILILAIGFVITAVVTAYSNPISNITPQNAAGVVAMIGAVAIGIERVVEFGWTVLGSKVGEYWPMTAIAKQIDDFEKGVFGAKEGAKQIGQTLDDLKSKLDKDELKNFESQFQEVQKQIDALRKLAPSGQRVNLMTVAALQGMKRIEQNFPTLEKDVAIARQSIAGFADFAATFKDNPGKRLISIFVGGLLGMVVTSLVGLDMFQAILGETIKLPGVAVALTGLVMGLGSNPTHDVIKILQEVKTARQAQNDPQLKQSGGARGLTFLVNTPSLGSSAGVDAATEKGAATSSVVVVPISSDDLTTYSLR